jgi:hypothetical protein
MRLNRIFPGTTIFKSPFPFNAYVLYLDAYSAYHTCSCGQQAEGKAEGRLKGRLLVSGKPSKSRLMLVGGKLSKARLLVHVKDTCLRTWHRNKEGRKDNRMVP